MTDAPVPSSSSGTDGLLIYDQCAQIVRSYGPPCDEHMRAGLLVAIEHFKGLYEHQLSVGATTGKPAPERLTPQNIAERLPSSDAAISGAGTPAQPPANPDAVKMYADALDAANKRISELEEREWQRLRDPAYPPEDVTPAMVSAGMGEIPEDGCEYEHVEAAYLAMRAVALSSTKENTP